MNKKRIERLNIPFIFKQDETNMIKITKRSVLTNLRVIINAHELIIVINHTQNTS